MSSGTQSELDPISYAEALRQFREANSQDPRKLEHDGERAPHALVESYWLEHYIAALESNPSWALRLCAHCQHLRRFDFARSEFPEGREGYLAWRRAAANRSFELAAAILRGVGVGPDIVECVEAVMTKKNRRHNRDVQTMEDALCLTFFRIDASVFAKKRTRDEVQRILERTWLKMSIEARALSLTEPYPEPLIAVLRDLAAGRDTPRE